MEWRLTDVDIHHIIPTALLIVGQGGLNFDENDITENVYSPRRLFLPAAILDELSFDVGRYLLKQFLPINGLLGMNMDSSPDFKYFRGPQQLFNKAKMTKGNTIKKATITAKTEREQKEEQRKKLLRKENLMADLVSSEMNMCQS